MGQVIQFPNSIARVEDAQLPTLAPTMLPATFVDEGKTSLQVQMEDALAMARDYADSALLLGDVHHLRAGLECIRSLATHLVGKARHDRRG